MKFINSQETETFNLCTVIEALLPLTSSKQVEIGVSAEHPESIMVPPEGLHPSPLRHVPHPDALVLRVGQDELLAWVEDGTGHIVVVAATRIQLPRLGL